MSKSGLGRGLNSLMATASEESGSGVGINELPLDSIHPNPNQPRTNFDEKGLEELAASIKLQGLLQPILVRPDGNKYQIIAGERRWQACRSLGLDTIPVRIMAIEDDAKTLELALIENLQRTNLNAIEEARGYKDLMNVSGMTQGELATVVSKSRVAITNALRLLDLPDEIQELLYEGKITAGHGRAILAVSDEEKRIKLASKVAAENLSVRETENLARLLSAGNADHTRPAPAPRAYKTVARKLRQQLGTNVRVKSVKGKNKIEIEFKDEDDLERVFSLICVNKEEDALSTNNNETNE